MTIENNQKIKQKFREIEDRKIEILLEISNINDSYSKKVSQLNFEYSQLKKEYYKLQLELIGKKDELLSSFSIVLSSYLKDKKSV